MQYVAAFPSYPHTVYMYSLGEYKAFVLYSKVFGQAYGPNVLMYKMSGKAISRAICAIHLLDAPLHYKLVELILPLEQEHSNTEFDGQF